MQSARCCYVSLVLANRFLTVFVGLKPIEYITQCNYIYIYIKAEMEPWRCLEKEWHVINHEPSSTNAFGSPRQSQNGPLFLSILLRCLYCIKKGASSS